MYLLSYIPHGHCYLWQPALVALHVVSDGLIALAYFSIPITLIYFIRQRQDTPYVFVFWLFSAFIVSCGISHLAAIWTLWYPDYWSSGAIKMITAVISLCTAASLVPIIPKAIALPSPAQLQSLNQDLEEALGELKQTQVQLIQSEKMSSLGIMIAGVAHEINNPLNFIYANLNPFQQYIRDLLKLIEQYRKDYPQPKQSVQTVIEEIDFEFLQEDIRQLMGSMEVGVVRIRDIVKSLRIFARSSGTEGKKVNIHEHLDSSLMILQHRTKPSLEFAGIKIVKEYGDLPDVICCPGQLNQVFTNIIANAIDVLQEYYRQPNPEALSNSPEILVRTEVAENNYIKISIKDNGPGISQETQDRLFDPFFTTKPVGKGTGLGLSISYQIIVDRHEGRLYCHSQIGNGAEFIIEIPQRK